MSQVEQRALTGCAWSLAGRGPRAALLRCLPCPYSVASPSASRHPNLAGGGGAAGKGKEQVRESGAGGTVGGGWDASSPGMRERLALLHFAAGFAAPAGAATVRLASAKCRCSTGCSIPWRQSYVNMGSHVNFFLALVLMWTPYMLQETFNST
jgi:hypothetical protein